MLHRRASAERSILRSIVVITTMAIVLALAPAAGAAPRTSGCELHPGDTTVTWQSVRRDVATVEIQWVDAKGRFFATQAIVVQNGPAFYTQQTPEGAVEFGVTFFDDAGQAFAVTGGTCT